LASWVTVGVRYGQDEVLNMTDQVAKPRDSLTDAVLKELVAFERVERELSRQERRERAARLNLPELISVRGSSY